jgi:nitroreductase
MSPTRDGPDPSEVVRPLLRVRQVRDFTDERIAEPVLDAIADAARWSGSSRNAQPWRFIVVRDADTIRALADAGLPQTRALASAAAAIAIVMPEAPGAGIANAYDEGRAAERILVSASLFDLGAAISWVRGDVRTAIGGLLGVPDGWFVRTVVALGHPTVEGRRPKSAPGAARLPRDETVRSERW